jgi:DNA polymerase elongation subunit (family B)
MSKIVSEVFIYTWVIDDADDELNIQAFGIDKNNKNVLLNIHSFYPYCYVELTPEITKNPIVENKIKDRIRYICKNKYDPKKSDVEIKTVEREKLYYADIENDNTYKKNNYFLCEFKRYALLKNLVNYLRKPVKIDRDSYTLKVHENKASPILQLCCKKNIPTCGWISFTGTLTNDDDKRSYCDYEYSTHFNTLQSLNININPNPYILSFDLEVNSSNPNQMPKGEIPEDKIFQISCIGFYQGSNTFDKYLLTLGEPSPEIVGEDVELRYFSTESNLLLGFTELVLEKNVNILTGYNIFTFDIPYLLQRAKLNDVIERFKKIGFIKGKSSEEKNISWSSSAYKNQQFEYLDIQGRIFVDLLTIVKRDFKFSDYKLKTVSEYFLGESKDPLTPKGIFKCYKIFTPKSLGIVGKYCVQDSFLVAKLFDILQVWPGLTESAKTCNVPIFSLYTQGQQIKVFSQIYKECYDKHIVVESDVYKVNENEHYEGAYVVEPIPGLYDYVVSFDFSSLYPSIIMAYNIDYRTLVMDENIPNEKCHIIEWESHVGCEHDQVKRKTKVKNIICGHFKYRFLKEPKGILPTLLKNLLDARKKTNKEISELKEKVKITEDKDEISRLNSIISVLDKRQLSYKISANSAYGAMGVKKGYLPLMIGAMCVTAKGRQSIEKAGEYLKNEYGAKLIYGDTDSTYVSFPNKENPEDLYNFCKQVEDEMMTLYPRPMKLAYEEKIYWRFFILTKKRYMALECDIKGKVSNKIFKRGVLLARRDNSSWLRELYSTIIMKVFYREPIYDILNILIDNFNTLFTNTFNNKMFVITKSVGDIKDYKIRPLADDEKKKAKRLKDLNCTEEEYNERAMPAQVQLAEKMKRRGKPVSVGTRLEYIVSDTGNKKDKLFNQIEDYEYFKDHSSILTIDFLYYLKLGINPIDEVLKIGLKLNNSVDKEKKIKSGCNLEKFVETQRKYRINKYMMLKELNELFSPKIKFVE